MFEDFGPAIAGLLPVVPLLIIVAEQLLPIPLRYHPLWIFRQSAEQLARKVHPSVDRPRMQQRISGLMATILLWILTVGLLSIFYAIAELDQLLSWLLLFFLLGSQPWSHERKLILRALQRELKNVARTRVSKFLHRECEQLSTFGIQKAVFEQSVIIQLQGWVGTLFWFALLGPIGALNYRVLFELQRAWPQRLPGWQDFGYVSAQLFWLFNWLPEKLLLLILWLSARISGRLPQVSFGDRYALFAYVAGATDAPLGGPIKYRKITVNRPRFGTQKTRTHSNCLAISRHLQLFQIIWLLLLIPLWLAINLQV